jgi:hypothetical protein
MRHRVAVFAEGLLHIYFDVWDNFVKMHKTLRMTPALAANVTDKLWSMTDLVALVDAHDAGCLPALREW